jgi:hypothetical protein
MLVAKQFFATVYFLSSKSIVMKYYITHPQQPNAEGNDYSIIKVNPADEKNFLEDYGHTVITSGSSLMEALLNFEQVKQQQPGS